jgi:hypothetical protein
VRADYERIKEEAILGGWPYCTEVFIRDGNFEMTEGNMKVVFKFLHDDLDEFTRFEVVRDGKEVS